MFFTLKAFLGIKEIFMATFAFKIKIALRWLKKKPSDITELDFILWYFYSFPLEKYNSHCLWIWDALALSVNCYRISPTSRKLLQQKWLSRFSFLLVFSLGVVIRWRTEMLAWAVCHPLQTHHVNLIILNWIVQFFSCKIMYLAEHSRTKQDTPTPILE